MTIERRTEVWEEPIPCKAFIVGEDEEVFELAERKWKEIGKYEWHAVEPRYSSDFIRLAKEIIFDVENNEPVFHFVMFMFDASSFEVRIERAFKTASPLSDNDVKNTLALALMENVPVVPNTPSVESALAKYHKEMLLWGFTTRDTDGSDVHFVLAPQHNRQADNLAAFVNLQLTAPPPVAELILMRQAVLEELDRRKEAARILATLELAIAKLEAALQSESRNERQIQRCLTQNPILFGVDYVRVIPHHQLGSDFEMDYALEHISGHIDLLEIEASTHKLFTQKGDPRQALVHAEQQVIDWLRWIEEHSEYARSKLPSLKRPTGYVIIGRSDMMTPSDREKLQWRNAILKGAILTMTYDDLLDRAKHMLEVFQGRSDH
jgi:hypothetical protein